MMDLTSFDLVDGHDDGGHRNLVVAVVLVAGVIQRFREEGFLGRLDLTGKLAGTFLFPLPLPAVPSDVRVGHGMEDVATFLPRQT